jgi:nucleotide-binding universal stress UspA family protein
MLAAEGQIGGWFGSTATHLLRKSAVPVWVMKPHPVPRYRRVLAALDRDVMDPGRGDLNVKILELASSLALAEESELHVAHAWSVAGETILRSRLGITIEEIEEIAEETRVGRGKWLESALSEVPAAADLARAHLPQGPPHEAIPKLVEDLEVDLVVMGTLGRSGVAGVLIGNTAERILNRVHCAVLAVKPDGFRSPVRL